MGRTAYNQMRQEWDEFSGVINILLKGVDYNEQKQFLDALRNIFKKARVADVESIIEVYEEHFSVGYEKGLTDSEIIKSLGTPEEIYASYVDAGYYYRYIRPRWW